MVEIGQRVLHSFDHQIPYSIEAMLANDSRYMLIETSTGDIRPLLKAAEEQGYHQGGFFQSSTFMYDNSVEGHRTNAHFNLVKPKRKGKGRITYESNETGQSIYSLWLPEKELMSLDKQIDKYFNKITDALQFIIADRIYKDYELTGEGSQGLADWQSAEDIIKGDKYDVRALCEKMLLLYAWDNKINFLEIRKLRCDNSQDPLKYADAYLEIHNFTLGINETRFDDLFNDKKFFIPDTREHLAENLLKYNSHVIDAMHMDFVSDPDYFNNKYRKREEQIDEESFYPL